MKGQFVFAAALLAALSTSTMAAPGTNKDVYSQVLAPVVQLNRSCSGTVIYSDRTDASSEYETYILTAKHCVADKEGVTHTVYLPTFVDNEAVTETAYKAKVVKTYGSHDLALLKLKDTTAHLSAVASLEGDKPLLVEGEDNWVVGYPAGLMRTLTQGSFNGRESTAYPDRSREVDYYRSSALISGGNSGGALFHYDDATKTYRLIGVTSAGIGGSAVALYVPIDAIRAFIKSTAPQIVAEPSK